MSSRTAAAPRVARRDTPAPAAVPAGEVRIIGGNWKRTRLPVANRPGLRPTPNRVRETLFNWLGQDLTGWRCVDAFAGSGALGLEAASRGAASVRMWEQEPALVKVLQDLCVRLGAGTVQLERGDAIARLRLLCPASVDLVLLDPPFDADLHEAALSAAVPALAMQGRIYLEAPTVWDEPRLRSHGLVALKYLRAGSVHAHLLGRRPAVDTA